eukprot:CAMPEP_0115280752 /NCGR_PEP_ID=MMETSP0270-20121206/58957_1 /TAXON_ID=71861 /ORGANISM="Scrippsiella trochoidea, Strain CCMP3099" /LENGTH=83 /DNA_ID=CAMNT_0002697513 /DNA_START=35 /DNA_END=286 /DNA_ORIENTATION=+
MAMKPWRASKCGDACNVGRELSKTIVAGTCVYKFLQTQMSPRQLHGVSLPVTDCPTMVNGPLSDITDEASTNDQQRWGLNKTE